jgi:hypothetical protein
MTNKEERKKQLLAAVEDTRKKLRQPSGKIAITYYDYFILVVIMSVLIRPDLAQPWWVYTLAFLAWERPRLILRHAALRVRQDKELRASMKLMLEEIEAAENE